MIVRSPDVWTLTASIVVLLRDDFGTERKPRGGVTVRLTTRPDLPIRNTLGDWVFADLPAGTPAAPFNYTVRVTGDYYLPVEQTVPVPDPASTYPRNLTVREIVLRPSIHYPFSPGTTQLRGRVLKVGLAVGGATVSVPSAAPYLTGPTGEFVFAFKAFATPSQTFTLTASHPVHGTQSQPGVVVERYKINSRDVVYP